MLSSKAFRVVCVAVMAAALPQKAAFAAFEQCGTASYYHEDFLTATGEHYKPDGISAAHRTLPFGTIVRVRHQKTGREVVVRINDRGPYINGRIIDLSRGAKRVIGMDGLAPVCLSVVGKIDRKNMVTHAAAEDNTPAAVKRHAKVHKSEGRHKHARRHGRKQHRYASARRSRHSALGTSAPARM